jgi:TPR repeat protein
VSPNLRIPVPFRVVTRVRRAVLPKAVRRCLSAVSVIVLIGIGAAPIAHADALARGTAAYSRGDYVRAAQELSPLAQQGNAKALGLLGYLYEHGFGEPQDYDAAADFYTRGAVQGNPFAQAMLGLMYDKGHGVPLDFILAYKWLNLAAARTQGHDQEAFARFRDAVASKMSKDEVAEGQRLALDWIAINFDPKLKAERGSLKSRHHSE